jgi:hypothetical protein
VDEHRIDGAASDGSTLDSEAFAASTLRARHVRYMLRHAPRMVMLAAKRIQEPTHLVVSGQVATTPTTTAVNGFIGDWRGGERG